jgi:hypothetical protein
MDEKPDVTSLASDVTALARLVPWAEKGIQDFASSLRNSSIKAQLSLYRGCSVGSSISQPPSFLHQSSQVSIASQRVATASKYSPSVMNGPKSVLILLTASQPHLQ